MAAALTDEQIERLHLEYAQTGKVDRAAKAAGVSWAAAKKYLDIPIDPLTPLSQVREQKKIDIAAKMGDLQIALIDALMQPDKIAKASYQELANTLGITTEKRLLITGQPTSRNHNTTDDPSARLSPDELEAAARIRAKLEASAKLSEVGS